MSEFINDMWAELGFTVKPMQRKIICRTIPMQESSPGGIFIPDKYRSFYHGPSHLRIIEAQVLAVGPEVRFIKKGDIICFQRLNFGRIWDLKDGTKGGWIDASQVLGTDTQAEVAKDVSIDEYKRISSDGAGVQSPY